MWRTFLCAPTTLSVLLVLLALTHRSTNAATCDGTPPTLVGEWEQVQEYPLTVIEAQGGIIGDDFVIISGFTNGTRSAANHNFALDLTDPNANWRRLADLPVPQGITHGAFVVVGTKLYMCGGYLGGHPGPHIDTCIVYDHTNDQWDFLESMPDGRGGGGLTYNGEDNSLVYAGGAERPNVPQPQSVLLPEDSEDEDDDRFLPSFLQDILPSFLQDIIDFIVDWFLSTPLGSLFEEEPIDRAFAEDFLHTWKFLLDQPENGWAERMDIPFLSNHMSYVTSRDGNIQMYLGGQMGENEFTGNVAFNYEYVHETDTWVRKEDLPFTRGHASSSTTAVGNCGLIVAGGSTNENGRTSDISYFDFGTNSWTSIGNLPTALNTPVCGIHYDSGYYYCFTGNSAKLAVRIPIQLQL